MSKEYTKAKLTPIPFQKTKGPHWHSRTRGETVQDALRRAGYTDSKIRQLAKDGHILVAQKYITTAMKAGQELYVLTVPVHSNKKDPIDRFRAIELD